MIGILVIIMLAIFTLLAAISHFNIDVSKYEISSLKIKEDIKIVQLSDLHSRKFGKNNEKLIIRIKEAKPDVIVCTGDMVNAKTNDLKELEVFIGQLIAIAKVYYVMGNREFKYSKEEYVALKTMLDNMGVIVLENEKSYLKENIAISGINYENRDTNEYYTKYKDNYLEKEKINKAENVLPKIDSKDFNILLVHSPNAFEKYADLKFDLVLAGHLHGGVVRIPFLGGLLSPSISFFPKYDAGMFLEKESTMCVSRGLGYGSLPFRILNNPEIVTLDIKSLHKFDNSLEI